VFSTSAVKHPINKRNIMRW